MAKEITSEDIEARDSGEVLLDSHDNPIEPGPSPEEQEGFYAEPDDGRVRIFDKPENVKKVIKIFMIACGIILAIDGAMFLMMYSAKVHGHGHDGGHVAPYALETMPFFYPVYGFVACVILVLSAIQLRKVVMRKEVYYDS